MSRENRDASEDWQAGWVGDHLYLRKSSFTPDEAQALAVFIAAGPPKARWRITRTFEEKPTFVSASALNVYVSTNLTDDDLEEVWGDE